MSLCERWESWHEEGNSAIIIPVTIIPQFSSLLLLLLGKPALFLLLLFIEAAASKLPLSHTFTLLYYLY
jgi:hypothetical protein